MIAFGSSITEPETYDRCAKKGIELVAEPDSPVLAYAAAGSIFRSYNLLLDDAAKLENLEALVLVHQDAEIVDPEFCAKVRRALADPEVGLVGCVGAIGVRSIAWWEGSVTWASFTHSFAEHGGGEYPAFSFAGSGLPAYARTGEVDTIDGFVMCFSPWVVENVRFDEDLGEQIHGYDFDYCLQVREAGRKVLTADLQVIHHHSLNLIGDPEAWVNAHMKVAEKWDGRFGQVGQEGGDWKQRARRAEAMAAAAHAKTVSTQMKAEARMLGLQRALDEVTGTFSWRITKPIRQLRRLLGRSAPEPERPRITKFTGQLEADPATDRQI
jgi:hypothetical protein